MTDGRPSWSWIGRYPIVLVQVEVVSKSTEIVFLGKDTNSSWRTKIFYGISKKEIIHVIEQNERTKKTRKISF